MTEDAQPSDVIPDKPCPKCGLANHGHAVYCMGCAAPLDRTYPLLRESGRLESFNYDMRIDHDPESQERVNQTFVRAGSKPWKIFLRGSGFFALWMALISALNERFWTGVGLISLFLTLYIGGTIAQRRKNLDQTANMRLGAADPDIVTDFVGCLDVLLRGVGCVAVVIVSIAVAFGAICFVSMGR